MQLRTFLAKDMREALATVRADMGPEAVIISSEKSKSGGVTVRAALDTPEAEAPAAAAEPVPAMSAIADFETHHRENLLRRLRGNGDLDRKSSLGFDRAELLAALNRHRLPEGVAHALAEAAASAQLTDMTLALASALDKKMRPWAIDMHEANALLLVGPNGAGKTAVAAKIAAHARLAGRRTTLVASDS